MTELSLNINEREFKLILRSLKERERQLDEVCAVSPDEDAAALAGNDLIALRLFMKDYEARGVRAFGESCLNISEDLL